MEKFRTMIKEELMCITNERAVDCAMRELDFESLKFEIDSIQKVNEKQYNLDVLKIKLKHYGEALPASKEVDCDLVVYQIDEEMAIANM